jgi:division protein CdvB (Snf7/Vps24/ESCRT-III family)
MGNKETKQVPQQSASDKMLDMLYEFKFMAKNLRKEATKAENAEKQFILKVKDAIEKNMPETARIHAADAIRKKNEARRYLTLSSKLDAVHARLQSAYQTQRVRKFFNRLFYNIYFSSFFKFLIKFYNFSFFYF